MTLRRMRLLPRNLSGEYAILIRSDFKGHGLGWLLMQLMIEYARSEGIRTIKGEVLRENAMMLDMCRELGFHVATDPQEPSSAIVSFQLSA